LAPRSVKSASASRERSPPERVPVVAGEQEPAEVGPRRPDEQLARVEDVVQHSLVRVESVLRLRQVADPHAGADPQAPRKRLHLPEYRAQKGRLARAVGPQAPNHFTGTHLERNIFDRSEVAESLGQPFGQYGQVSHAPPPAAWR